MSGEGASLPNFGAAAKRIPAAHEAGAGGGLIPVRSDQASLRSSRSFEARDPTCFTAEQLAEIDRRITNAVLVALREVDRRERRRKLRIV